MQNIKNWEKNYPDIEEITENSLDENSSLKKILDFVGEGKEVADFGCATGYLAHLLQKKGCTVTGVEINADAAKVAANYCQQVIVADLDFVSVKDILPSQKFDVAVFGDILEHLRNPWKVLKETQQILKKDGYVIASIPNIAHAAIRLSLLQGKFEYMEFGILDNTHLRFFTKKTLEDMFDSSGYWINSIERTKMAIFSDSMLLPKLNKQEFSSDIIKQMESDEDADTLQFIIRADPQPIEEKYAFLKEEYSQLVNKSKRLQSQLESTQAALELAQSQLIQTQSTISGMESSKFWKLRKAWFTLKKVFGWNKENS
ncbi:methyltransferase domain-containing protein [Calothrix sp. FACHB-1219]|uniref:class I SAM-dependent methyltransferase n=1 Tax=unclassified Calothrix TaxID=2619626 RepID=UPI001682E9BC|nr:MULTISPECIES: class I SAM-dependent methyltransferase [unclassified Calothrix]MBD2206523.1 methyltransferase domain-containing protein [Calothrix sp. FACHB-168]MBD2221319.1 methyltransferase domain-containing protein [Calothrix sp. FACHB-1219]